MFPVGTDAGPVGLLDTPRKDGEPILSNSCGAGIPQLARRNVANTPGAAAGMVLDGFAMNSLSGPFEPGFTPSASALHAARLGSAIAPANRRISVMMGAPRPPGRCRPPK